MHFSSKRSDLYQHTRSRATNIVYKHITKTTVYKTYTWCKGREIAIRKGKKGNRFLYFYFIFKLNWLHPALFEGREEAGVPGENPR